LPKDFFLFKRKVTGNEGWGEIFLLTSHPDRWVSRKPLNPTYMCFPACVGAGCRVGPYPFA
jgi:hypothetical protein